MKLTLQELSAIVRPYLKQDPHDLLDISAIADSVAQEILIRELLSTNVDATALDSPET